MTPSVSGSTQCKEIDQDSSLCQCVCVCVLVECGIQFSAPINSVKGLNWSQRRGNAHWASYFTDPYTCIRRLCDE